MRAQDPNAALSGFARATSVFTGGVPKKCSSGGGLFRCSDTDLGRYRVGDETFAVRFVMQPVEISLRRFGVTAKAIFGCSSTRVTASLPLASSRGIQLRDPHNCPPRSLCSTPGRGMSAYDSWRGRQRRPTRDQRVSDHPDRRAPPRRAARSRCRKARMVATVILVAKIDAIARPFNSGFVLGHCSYSPEMAWAI